jgi:hypothetical protein
MRDTPQLSKAKVDRVNKILNYIWVCEKGHVSQRVGYFGQLDEMFVAPFREEGCSLEGEVPA